MYFLRSRVIRTARLKFAGAFIAAYLLEGVAFMIYLNRDEFPYSGYVILGAHILSGLSFILLTTSKRGVLSGVGYYYPRYCNSFYSFYAGHRSFRNFTYPAHVTYIYDESWSC